MAIQGFSSLSILVLMVLFATNFRRLQNKKTATGQWTGGEISWPKAFWLAYALGSWFLVPFVFYLSDATFQPFKVVLLIQILSWWVRGALELFMIYRWFNWSPIYGISHDSVHNTVLFGATAIAAAKIGWPNLMVDHFNLLVFAYLVAICFCMMAEVVFAALFIMTRGLSAGKIYFASDSAEYRLINQLTFTVCIIVYAHMVFQSIALFFV